VGGESVRPLRVLHVSQPTTGGVAVCVRELARAGVEAGLDVTIACPGDGELSGWAADVGARWHRIDLERAPRPGDLLRAVRMRPLLRSADVVHLHSSKAGALGRLAIRSMRGDRPGSVFTPHGWSWQVGGRLAAAYRSFERLAAPWSDVIVAVSDDTGRLGQEVLGGRARDLRVIPNGVDTARFTPDGPAAARGPDPLIVCVGRLSEAKGQDVLIEAMAAMRTPGVRVRLVGIGEDEAALRAQAEQLQLADRVELAGSDPAPERQYRAADVVCVPSRWDGLSLVLLEAMAAGAAIVATRVPGVTALGRSGVIVSPQDPVGLAGALDEVLADGALRSRMGAAARRVAVEQFDLTMTAERSVSLWREVAA
jgi:glycosyltransferase involved in cell wall biosynthesis